MRFAAQNSTRLELYASAQISMDLYRTDGSNATSYLKAAAADDDGACLVQAEAKTITAYAEFVPRGDARDARMTWESSGVRAGKLAFASASLAGTPTE